MELKPGDQVLVKADTFKGNEGSQLPTEEWLHTLTSPNKRKLQHKQQTRPDEA